MGTPRFGVTTSEYGPATGSSDLQPGCRRGPGAGSRQTNPQRSHGWQIAAQLSAARCQQPPKAHPALRPAVRTTGARGLRYVHGRSFLQLNSRPEIAPDSVENLLEPGPLGWAGFSTTLSTSHYRGFTITEASCSRRALARREPHRSVPARVRISDCIMLDIVSARTTKAERIPGHLPRDPENQSRAPFKNGRLGCLALSACFQHVSLQIICSGRCTPCQTFETARFSPCVNCFYHKERRKPEPQVPLNLAPLRTHSFRPQLQEPSYQEATFREPLHNITNGVSISYELEVVLRLPFPGHSASVEIAWICSVLRRQIRCV